MKKLFLLSFVLPLLGLESAISSKAPGAPDWVQQSISQDTAVAAAAQEHLRESGPSGLQMLVERYAPQIAAHQTGAPSDEQWKRIAFALDKVGGQYDDYASQLYWYTDLEKAQAAAQASGRTILSLRLLGRLDEDLSCANSRFFRTTLYPSAEVNRILTLDPKTFELRQGEAAVALSAREVKLMQLLLSHPGEVLSRDRILNDVWGYEYFGNTRVLDQAIVQLRKKLAQVGADPRQIATVHTVGYRWLRE